MSEKRKGHFQGKDNPFFGKTHTAEQKEKWSKERKGRDTKAATEASFAVTRRKVINLDTGEIFQSVNAAATRYNIPATHISRVCRGKRKTTGGFHWEYYNQ